MTSAVRTNTQLFYSRTMEIKIFFSVLRNAFTAEDIFCLDYFLLSKVKEGRTYVEKKAKFSFHILLDSS